MFLLYEWMNENKNVRSDPANEFPNPLSLITEYIHILVVIMAL